MFVSGQIPSKLDGSIVSGDIKAETNQVMENIGAILNQAGLTFDHVIKTSIFLTDMQSFGQVNEAYGTYFTSQFPARETVQVAALPKGVNVEISVIAVKP